MKEKLFLPRIIAMIAALIAIVAFFLPYISATEDYQSYMVDQADEKPFENVDITVREIMDMSLFKYARVYFQGGEAFFGSSGTGTFYGVLITLIAGFALFTLLAAWRKRPVLTMICDLLMGGAFYLVNWDFVDRGIMPDSDRVWTIAYHLYYPLVAIIAICAVWMSLSSGSRKRQWRRKPEQPTILRRMSHEKVNLSDCTACADLNYPDHSR